MSTEFEEEMAFLIRDIITNCYGTAPNEAYRKLKKVHPLTFKVSPSANFFLHLQISEAKGQFINTEMKLDLMAQHINALTYLISSGDHKTKVVAVHPVEESRKRKLRTTDQTCKLMKLGGSFQSCGNSIHDVIRDDLKKLYEGKIQ